MSSMTERLQKLQAKHQKANEELTRLQGRRDQLMEQLETEFDITSVEDAQARLDVLEKDLTRRTERAERLLSQLEEQVDV